MSTSVLQSDDGSALANHLVLLSTSGSESAVSDRKGATQMNFTELSGAANSNTPEIVDTKPIVPPKCLPNAGISWKHALSIAAGLPTVRTLRVGKAHQFTPIEDTPLKITKSIAPSFSQNLAQDLNLLEIRKTNGERRRGESFSHLSHTVEKRNARERTRVHTVNQAFSILKNHLPALRANTKRVSKLKILKNAIDYVYLLRNMIKDYDKKSGSTLQTNGNGDASCPKLSSVETEMTPTAPPVEDRPPSLSATYVRPTFYQPPILFPPATTHYDSSCFDQAFSTTVTNQAANSAFELLNQTLSSHTTSSAFIKLPYVNYESPYVSLPPPPECSNPYASYMTLPTNVSVSVVPTMQTYAPDSTPLYYPTPTNYTAAVANTNFCI